MATQHIISETMDAMAFIMRSGAGMGANGDDLAKPRVLEVAEIWGDTVMDVKHFKHDHSVVQLGDASGYRWRFMGIPIAWVSPAFAKFAWLLAPTLSEAQEELRGDFFVPEGDLHQDDSVLFEASGDGYVFNLSDEWLGFADIGPERFSFQELMASGKAEAVGPGRYQLPIEPDTRVVANLGHLVFVGQSVPAAQRVRPMSLGDVDTAFLGLTSLMSFLMLMLYVVYSSAGPPPVDQVVEVPARFVEILLEQPEPKLPQLAAKAETTPDAGQGAKAKKEEGKVGKQAVKMENAKGQRVALKKTQQDKLIAENAGVLGALRDGADLDGVFGTATLNANLAGGIGSLVGAKGVQMGSAGLVTRGSAIGGGGTTGVLGGLGTKGIGGGELNYGREGGEHGPKREGGIGRVGGDPIILGALDRSLIDSVIKRHMNQLRHCYQRALQRSPNLAGKIAVKFIIGQNGRVSKASTKYSTMGSPAVEMCINDRFMRLQFPAPKGDGIVIVSYPFIFSPG
jgi:hypothetical protein